MSLGNMADSLGDISLLSDAIFENEMAKNCLVSMGEISENVAELYGITREKQDQMAYESNLKAAEA